MSVFCKYTGLVYAHAYGCATAGHAIILPSHMVPAMSMMLSYIVMHTVRLPCCMQPRLSRHHCTCLLSKWQTPGLHLNRQLTLTSHMGLAAQVGRQCQWHLAAVPSSVRVYMRVCLHVWVFGARSRSRVLHRSPMVWLVEHLGCGCPG